MSYFDDVIEPNLYKDPARHVKKQYLRNIRRYSMAVNTSAKQDYEPVVLAGHAYYTFVHSPQKDDAYGDKYKVDLVVEDEEGNPFIFKNANTGEEINMVAKVQELGLELRTAPAIPGRYVRIASKAIMKDGTKRPAVPVADTEKNPIGPDTLIGNGSRVRVRALIHPWGVGKRSGVSALLDRMIVDELVPYVNKKADGDFDFPHMRKSAQKDSPSASKATAKGGQKDDVPFEE